MAALLEINGLWSGYGKGSVLQDVSLRVEPLETVSVLGANGAGKTTLLNSIAGVIKPSQGKILFKGEDVTGGKPETLAGKGLSLVLQGRSIFPFMTVQENLDMGAYLLKDGPSVRKRLDIVFQLFPALAERKNQWAGSMSGGEQKMLELGRALMLDLKLLMLDEPSLGLAPLIMNTIFRHIREFNQRGLTVLLVEQNVSLALEISHRGYLIELGRIRVEGKKEDLLDNPEVKKYYLGISPE
jgi:ABC-type branched-subunit amino acid transport system ATPase component